jgi:hypothetical protein
LSAAQATAVEYHLKVSALGCDDLLSKIDVPQRNPDASSVYVAEYDPGASLYRASDSGDDDVIRVNHRAMYIPWSDDEVI